MSSTRGTELSREWGQSLVKSIEASVRFGDASVSAGLSVEQRYSVSQMVSEQLTSGPSEIRMVCNAAPGGSHVSLWSWEVTGSEKSSAQTLPDSTYLVVSNNLACTDIPNPPCCPPGYWTDIKCHDGTSPFVVATDCKKYTKARPNLR